MLVFRILRSNPHVLNYVLITGAVLGPVLAYAYTNSPSTEELDDALVSIVAWLLRKIPWAPLSLFYLLCSIPVPFALSDVTDPFLTDPGEA